MGVLVAEATGWALGDKIPLAVSQRFGKGIWHPEYRLWNFVFPGFVAPTGLGIFGAGLQYHLHFMVLAVGLFLVVFAATISVPVCINYATECFLQSANEVAIAMNMYRLGFSIALGFFRSSLGSDSWPRMGIRHCSILRYRGCPSDSSSCLERCETPSTLSENAVGDRGWPEIGAGEGRNRNLMESKG